MNIRSLPVGAISLGVFLGLMLSPASHILTSAALDVYDKLSPVVTVEVILRERKAESIDVTLRGQKHRACGYIGINAYMHANGETFDAALDRTDKRETGATRPADGQMLDMGTWRIQPLKGAKRMTIVMQHQCSGRLVLTEIGALDL